MIGWSGALRQRRRLIAAVVGLSMALSFLVATPLAVLQSRESASSRGDVPARFTACDREYLAAALPSRSAEQVLREDGDVGRDGPLRAVVAVPFGGGSLHTLSTEADVEVAACDTWLYLRVGQDDYLTYGSGLGA